MEKRYYDMLNEDVVDKKMSYDSIVNYLKHQRSMGNFTNISDEEIMSYLRTKMMINSNVPNFSDSHTNSASINKAPRQNTYSNTLNNYHSEKNITPNVNNIESMPKVIDPSANSTGTVTNNSSSDVSNMWELPKEELIAKTVNVFSGGTTTNGGYKPKIVGDALYSTPGGVGHYQPKYGVLPEGEKYSNQLQLQMKQIPVVNDNGRVQIKFDFKNVNNATLVPNLKDCSLTFTPGNSESMHRLVAVFPGDKDWPYTVSLGIDVDGKPCVNTGGDKIDNYYLNTTTLDADCTILRVQPYMNNSGISEYIPHILDELNAEFSNGNENTNYQNRYTFVGASVGSVNMLEAANAVVADRLATSSDNHTPIDMMLLDTKGDVSLAQEPGVPFVKKMNNYPELKNEMIRTGSIIYACEAKDGNGVTQAPSVAINNLGTLTEDGMIIVDVENEIVKAHGGNNSFEFQFTNGSIGKTVYDYDGVTNETVTMLSNGTNEAPNKYYLVLPESEWDPEKPQDYYNQRKEITEKQLNDFCKYREMKGMQESGKYLNDLVGYVNYEGNEEASGYINLSSGATISDDNILFDFQAIIDKTNNVAGEVSKTSFRNDAFDYQLSENSTADFPESLNRSNAFLYGISSNLLNTVESDTKNIGQMLSDYITLDKAYGDKALEMMDGEYTSGKYFQTDILIDSTGGSDINNAYYGLFADNVKEGSVGKIAMSDIDNILSGNMLIGKIGQGLNNEYEDAERLQNAIEEIINMSQGEAMGKSWQAEKDRLIHLADCCEARKIAVNNLQEAYIAALNHVKDYYNETASMLAGSKIDLGESLDDGNIPIYEAKNVSLHQEIADLKTEYAECDAVPEMIGTGGYIHLPNGQSYEIMKHNPAYDDARNRMAEIKILVPQKEEEIAYNEIYIGRLKGLATTLNEANEIIQAAMEEINGNYAKMVNDIPIVNLAPVDLGTL